SGHLLRTIDGDDELLASSVFSPDGTRILSGGLKGLRIWDARTGRLLRAIDDDSKIKGVRSVAFSSDGKYLLSGHRDHTVRIWDAEAGAPIRVLQSLNEEAGSVAFSPDGKFVLAAGFFGTRHFGPLLWDAKTGALVQSFKLGSETVAAGSS